MPTVPELGTVAAESSGEVLMQDAELRSSLRRYFETAIEQDQKLKNVLVAFAKKVGPKSPFYGYFCAHMEQLAAREVISEDLLAELQDEETHRPAQESPTRESSEVVITTGRALDEFEKQLIRTYNYEPDKWARKYRPASFGAANVDDIWRSGGEPKFTKKEGGIYHLVADSGRYYVVPEPGLKLQDSYFRSEGLGQMFDCPNLEAESGGSSILLISPAVVEDSGDRWTVTQKGELRERRSR